MRQAAGDVEFSGSANGVMAEPTEETCGADGTDLTLIRWMLSLSPRERLEVLQAGAGSLERLREHAVRRTLEEKIKR